MSWQDNTDKTSEEHIKLLNDSANSGKYLYIGISSNTMTIMRTWDKVTKKMHSNYGYYVTKVTDELIIGFHQTNNLSASYTEYKRHDWYVEFVERNNFITHEELEILKVN